MIAAVEDAIVAAVKAATLDRAREVDSLPAGLSADELRARTRSAPAIYVAFLGGQARAEENRAGIDGQWALYFLTATASGEKARRRGDGTSAGAYELMEAAIPALNDLTIAGVGSLSLTQVSNLFVEGLDKLGFAIYSAEFRLPMMFAPLDPAGLAPFETFHADYELPPLPAPPPAIPEPAGAAKATDQVSLPQ